MGLSEVITYISYTLLISTSVLEGFGILKTTVFCDSKISNLHDYILKECSTFTLTKSYLTCFLTTFFYSQIDTIIFFKGNYRLFFYSGCKILIKFLDINID